MAEATYDFEVIGVHGPDVESVEGSQVRVRMFLHDLGQVVDEDFPLAAPFDPAALAPDVRARMDAIRAKKKAAHPQAEAILVKDKDAAAILEGRADVLAVREG
jgi:hypothetical protein